MMSVDALYLIKSLSTDTAAAETKKLQDFLKALIILGFSEYLDRISS